ncbi:MAG TPA: tetratricopeptide repeat protein [Calidithermus sp.]|nr:tetratricopeptide repeat protein [Calidithermus sp.]
MPSLIGSLRTAVALGRLLHRLAGAWPRSGRAHPEAAALVRRGDEARRAGRGDEARQFYRQALERNRYEPGALRGLRDLAIQAGAWAEALVLQERVLAVVGSAERRAEAATLAAIHYELGRAAAGAGRAAEAVEHFRGALRADPAFVPAAVALGDAHEAAGERREAVRTWERAAEHQPALPLLVRLERVYREEGRPSRMIALYREAAERAPDDLAVAVALGRVYFELEMLDEAADQFEKVEVRAPDLPVVHAYLGAVFERRGETREAFAEYRRALRLAGAFEWPHRCAACGAPAPAWQDRCPGCGRWNTIRPVPGR